MWACRIQGKNSWNVVTVWTVHTLQIPASKKEVVGEGIRATNVTNLLWSRLKLIKIMLHFPTWLEEKKRDPDYLEQCRGVTGLGLWFAHKHQQRRLSSTSLETSGDCLIFISHHQDYQFFQKDPSTGLTQQVPVQQSLAVFILGMGTGMTYFLERLVWASMAGTGGGGTKGQGDRTDKAPFIYIPISHLFLTIMLMGWTLTSYWLWLAFLQVQHYCQRDCGFLKWSGLCSSSIC